MRILSIHAHPDDAEILAGGTLKLLADRGHHITMVTMTPGDCGTNEYPPEEISRIRKGEAAAAAALIGADYLWAGFRDLAIFNDDPSRRQVTAVLRQTRPDIVLTSAPSDYLCDHEMTHLLVRDACFGAPAPNYQAPVMTPIKAIPHLYCMDPIGGHDRHGNPVTPDFIVDVSPVFQMKWDMLACHESQRNWLRAQHGMDDYMETMRAWTTRRGQQAGVAHGEGFIQYKGHPYPESPLLQELLAGALAGTGR